MSRPHSVDGSFTLSETVGTATQLSAGSLVGIGFAKEFTRTFTVMEISQSPSRTILRLREVTSREEALALADQAVFIMPSDVLANESDRYSVADIMGCTVIAMADDETPEAYTLGTITDVLLLPANDVWVVYTPSNQEILLPVVEHVVRRVNIPNKTIHVALISGLLDPESEDGP